MSGGNRKNNNIDCSNVLQCANESSVPNSKFLPYSKDLAPVHCPTSAKTMASQPSNNCSQLHPGEERTLSSHFNKLLDLSAKKCELNGTNIITTDADIHHGPTEHVNCTKEKNETTTRAVNSCITSLEALQNCSTSQKHTLSHTTSNLCKTQNENGNSKLKSKEKFQQYTGDVMCNGHSVSETTSSNSIAVSDISLSYDKSLDSSAFSLPSNIVTASSSQSKQQQCDITSSSGSDSYKIPDISFSPLLTSICLPCNDSSDIIYTNYVNENQMSSIMKLIQKDLSEPYSIYTYRYFIHNWPKLCYLAIQNLEVVGAIVCKLDMHKKTTVRGYIAMLAVDQKCRKRKIGSNLVLRAIRAMANDEADEVVLETEITNQPALKLYENLGFVRDKRLFRYYLNGVDALRLKLWLR